MYEIEYYVVDDSSPAYYHIDSNYLPRSDDDVTIDGKNYKVISVKHILDIVTSSIVGDTLEERFIVTVTEMTEEEHEALRAKRKSNIH